MLLQENYVSWLYRIILLREPENDEIIKRKITSQKNIFNCINSLLNSEEYNKLKLNKYMASSEFNSEPKIIYLHIPKTAGKAFEKLAEKNYGNEACLSTTGEFDRIKWIKARLIGGHFFYSKYNGMVSQRLFISVVRDPVERALSRFNY